MSEYHTMYHDGYAKAFFIETPTHERLAIFPYGRGQGDVALDVAKEAASKALDFINGQISGAHPERYFRGAGRGRRQLRYPRHAGIRDCVQLVHARGGARRN